MRCKKGAVVSQADVELVERFMQAFVAGDLETVFELCHPELVIKEADGVPYPGDHVGIEGLQNLLTKILEPFEMRVDSYEVSGVGSCVMLRWLIEFKSRASGRSVMMPGVELYSIADGQVSEIDVYYKDTKAIHELVAG